MTNEEILTLLKQGVEAWNEWRKKNPDVKLDLSQANLSQADLSLVNLSQADLSLVNFSQANLSLANLSQANLRWIDLSRANLRWADLSQANLSLANLSLSNLNQANLSEANLRWADLSRANLVNVDLSGTDLSGANLSKTDLSSANVVKADLSGADLNGANLTEANLSDADLRGANLREANLIRVNLTGADLTGANLAGANLFRTQVLGANFTQAILAGACIEDWSTDENTSLAGAIFEDVLQNNSEQPSKADDDTDSSALEDTALLLQSSATVDLTFSNGIDWKAFLLAFYDVQEQYGEQSISIQALENRSNVAFVVRLNVPPELDTADLESYVTKQYQTHFEGLELTYRTQQHATDEQLIAFRQQNVSLIDIIKLQARRAIANQAAHSPITKNTNHNSVTSSLPDSSTRDSPQPLDAVSTDQPMISAVDAYLPIRVDTTPEA